MRFLAPRADRLGEVGEHELEVDLADVVGDVPHRAAGRRLDEARHIEPFEAMMADRHGPLADGSPHPACDRLQADAMLVRRPDLDLCVRMLAALVRGSALELFLSRARSCSVAAIRMLRTRLLDRVADGDERIPTALVVHRFEPVVLRQPARDLRARPHPAVVRWRLQTLFQLTERIRRQDRRLGAVVGALIAKLARATLVVALDEDAHPARRERQHLRRLIDVVAPRQQPKRVKVALRDRLGRRAVTLLEFGNGKMRPDGGHDRAPLDNS